MQAIEKMHLFFNIFETKILHDVLPTLLKMYMVILVSESLLRP